MTKTRLMILFLGLTVLLLSASIVGAKGEWGKVTISGNGLIREIEITDPVMLEDLALGTFQDLALGEIVTPQVVGAGYSLLRGWENEDGVFVPFDNVHYYPDPAGERGYVYYDGLVNGSSEFDRRWYRVTPAGDAVMQQIFNEYEIQPLQPGQIPAMVLAGHTDAVNVLAWSPDGTLLASSGGDWDSTDYHVRLWGADGSLFKTLAGHIDAVTSAAWSPDGSLLATGSADETIRLWNADGNWIRRIEARMGTIFALSWSPDGQMLASASLAGTRSNTIQIWSVDGTLLHTLPTQYSGGKFLNVAWSPDGQYLAGGNIDFRLWRADGTLVYSHETCERCTPGWGLAWSPDSQLWSFGNQSGNIWVYDTQGQLVAQLQNPGNVDSLVWSPDGTMLAGGNTLWDWDGETFRRRGVIDSGRIAALAWSPDGTMIAAAGSNQNNVRVWDTNGNRLAILTGHPGNVNAVAWSPDGRLLASAGEDKTIRLWDMAAIDQSG